MNTKNTDESNAAIMVVADYFYPRALPAESTINTRFVEELQEMGNVLVWAEEGSEIPQSGVRIAIVGRVRHWGFKALVRICASIVKLKPKTIFLMYDAGAFSKSAWISLLPPLIKVLVKSVNVVTHFTNEVSVPLTRNQKRILRRMPRIGLMWANECIGTLGASDQLVFYCKKHRDTLVRNMIALEKKSTVVEVPSTVRRRQWSHDDVLKYRYQLTGGKEIPIICYFGLLYPNKNVEVLLRASSILGSEGMLHKLLIIGGSGGITRVPYWNEICDKYKADLLALSTELQIVKNVIWKENLEEKQLSLALSSADIAVLPYQHGAMANNSSLVTCLVHELPVITTAAEATDEFMRDSKAMVFVSPADPGELSEAIKELVVDSEKRIEIKMRVQSFVSQYFNWDRFVAKMYANS